MPWCTNGIVLIFVIVIIQCDAQVEIEGKCPSDLGTKLPTNWLAMGGKWYEIMRIQSLLQFRTTCVSITVSNIDRHIQVNHSYKNTLQQIKNYPSIFELSSNANMSMCFMPGITKPLTLLGTDYLNCAVFSYCTPRTTKTSNMYFWVFCRENTKIEICKDLCTFIFKLRRIENMLPYLDYTDHTSCPA